MNPLKWVKANKWIVIAYIAFFAVFWFFGGGTVRVSPASAYFGVILLHLVFLYGVHIIRQIIRK